MQYGYCKSATSFELRARENNCLPTLQLERGQMYIGFAANTFQRRFAQIIPTCHFKSNPFNALRCGPAEF